MTWPSLWEPVEQLWPWEWLYWQPVEVAEVKIWYRPRLLPSWALGLELVLPMGALFGFGSVQHLPY